MTESAEDENLAKLPKAIRIAIEVEKARAEDAQSLIDLALTRAEQTPGFTREEQPVLYLPDKTNTIVHAEAEGIGFRWEINYRKDWSGSQELRVSRFTHLPEQRGENYYQVLVSQREDSTEFPPSWGGTKITIPTGSYYYEEMGSGTEHIRGRNDPQIMEKINAFFASFTS